MKCELVSVIPSENILGECVIWDVKKQSICWTDIQASQFFKFAWQTQKLEIIKLPERLGSFALTKEEDIILGAFASGFAEFNLENGKCSWLARPELIYTGTRFNDGRVDRQGRFWSGTMVETPEACDDQGEPVLGSLYCLENELASKKMGGFEVPNSLCWSRDGGKAFFADSRKKTIWSFDFDRKKGIMENKRIFATTDKAVSPDGSCIDSDDFLWNAEFRGGRIVRYSPDGIIDHELKLPVSKPTCVTFGGPELDYLLVTSAREKLTEEEISLEPQAGNLFIYKTDCTGLEENRVKR